MERVQKNGIKENSPTSTFTTPVKSPPRRTFKVPSLKKGGEFHHWWLNNDILSSQTLCFSQDWAETGKLKEFIPS
jgi:hypothetical protein